MEKAPYYPSAPLDKPVGRTVDLNIPADPERGLPELVGPAVVTLDPVKGIVVRLKRRQREVTMSLQEFIDRGKPCAPAKNNRRHLQGK